MHDELASRLVPECMAPGPPDELELELLRLAAPQPGQLVLDLGCGQGNLSLELLGAGTEVIGVDISPGMVDVARRRAELYRPTERARFLVADAGNLPLADSSVDMVVGKWVLHHLDSATAVREIRRVLRPGGRGVFVENQGTNPLLHFAREHLVGRFWIPRLGSQDEHPLMDHDYELFRRECSQLEIIYPNFFFIRLFDRQIIRQRSRRISRVCHALDSFVYKRFPALRKYSFNVVVVLDP